MCGRVKSFFWFFITPIILIVALILCRILIKTCKRYIYFTPEKVFTIGFLSYLILICSRQISFGNSALDIHLDYTYFVTPHSYPLFFALMGFAICASIYLWGTKFFKRQLNNTLGYIHFWVTFLSTSFLIFPIQYIHLMGGMPRRYYDYGISADHTVVNKPSMFITTMTCLLIIAQLLFLYNLLNSIFRKNA
ncbi:MAG: hypothetical protein CFE25_06140 [Chitinophagaceae bacterium BSSC1]|nr:MAG: hypothetical protein CFE25_06140 [Chitinophagaceae bacterium BSSC1]